jgi:copper(I)-binding protein
VKTLAGAMLAVLLAGCGGSEAPVASDAWVRLAAVPGRPAAGYFTLHGGAKPMTLAALEVAGVPRVEMHESRMTGNGMMAMDAVASVPVPAGGTVAFAPGGYHAMLFGVPASFEPGATVTMRFRFQDGSAVEAPAKVVGAGEAGPE